MIRILSSSRSIRFYAFSMALLGLCMASTVVAYAQEPSVVSLTQISSDPFTVAPGQHATEVEPHMLANGTTLVAAFQTGRIAPGGATAIGWATSTDGGSTWMHGFLPGLTTGNGGGPFSAASDPAVAYDPKHGVWMIATLPISNTSETPAVEVSRSTDGGLTWNDPVSVGPNVDSSDKNWIACDSTSTSPYYGNCYVEWDNPDTGDEILMSTSSDGGMTWGPATAPAMKPFGIGGQPLVLAERHGRGADRDLGDFILCLDQRRNELVGAGHGFEHSGSHRCRRYSQRPLALRGSRWSRHGLGGVGRLPLPNQLLDQRSGVQHLQQRFDLVGRQARSHRSCHQHRSTTSFRYRHRSYNFGHDRARRDSLLFLSGEQVYGHDLPPWGGLHFVAQRRKHLERSSAACRPHATGLAAQFAKRTDGRRLHCHRLHQRSAARRLRSSRGEIRHNVQRSHLHRAGLDNCRDRPAIFFGRRQAAAPSLRRNRAGAAGKGQAPFEACS
jgi:hypothetical protein